MSASTCVVMLVSVIVITFVFDELSKFSFVFALDDISAMSRFLLNYFLYACSVFPCFGCRLVCILH